MHRLFDPLIDEAADARRRPGLEDQPAGAHRQRSASASRSTSSREAGPDHEKTFTAVVAGRRRGATAPAPAAARRRPSRRPPRPPGALRASCPTTRPTTSTTPYRRLSRSAPTVPELPEVEVVRRGLDRWVAGRTHRRGRGPPPTRRPPARRPARADFAARLVGRTVLRGRRGAASTSGCRWTRTAAGRRPRRPPRDERPAARAAAPGAADETHLRVRFGFTDDGPRAALRRPAHLRRARRRAARRTAPTARPARRSRTSPATRSTRRSTTPAFAAALRRRAHRAQARAARPDAWSRGIGNIYADEALWRARLHCGRPTDDAAPARGRRACSRRRATVMTEALGGGRHVLRRAVRQRQRRERLLRPVAGRLRPAGRAVPALRHADPPRAVHEPVVVPLPALPAAAPDTCTSRDPQPPAAAILRE